MSSVMRGRGRDWRQLALWSAVEAVPVYLSGRLVADAVDHGFLAGRPGVGFALLGLLGVGTLVGAAATRQTSLRLAALVEPLRDELVRRSVAGALHRAILPTATSQSSGVARVTQHAEIVREAYASILMVVQAFVVTAAGAILGLLSLGPVYLLLVVPPVVAGLALFLAALGRLAASQRASILAEERIAEYASGVVGGIADVVACGGERLVEAAVGRHIDAQAEATRSLARLTAVRSTAVALGGWLPLVLILLAGPWLLGHGSSTGTILGALTYVSGSLHPALESLVRGLGGPGLWLLVTLRRVVEATEERTRSDPVAAAPAHEGGQAARPVELTLRGVTFAYGPASAPVVSRLDLHVADGEHLAVVGPSGAGKSTLAAVMTGVLWPQSGSVELGGTSIRGRDLRWLADHRVLVPQEPYVFLGTVRENLAYLHPDATDAELDGVVVELGLAPVVDRFGGYDAELTPVAMSAGQRQLVAVARAYLSPAALVVLDEATSDLDASAEARVELAFRRRPGSLVVVAHRISSALRADRVVVLDGRDVVVGTHEELLGASRLYQEMVGLWQPRAGASS
jgi:ATP-binding cassette subfamily C protein